MKKARYQKYFEGKSITVMGIGTLGRGLGDISFLAKCGANIIATDQKEPEKLKKSLQSLKKYPHISYTLGRHSIQDFRKRDMILKGAGVGLKNKYIETAKDEGIPVHMSFSLVMDILQKEDIPVTVIGVTGTKGKSTTTGMIAALLKKAGESFHLGGNIRGVANLPLLQKVEAGDIILAELDSWQLQGFRSVKVSPNIAVFTNFFEDHLNYYDGSMRDYFRDKSAIFRYQNKGDHLVLTSNAQKAVRKYYRGKIHAERHLAKFSSLPASWDYHIFGRHNESNLALAYTVGKILQIPHAIIKETLTSFKGVEGRFEYLGEKKDTLFFNDNNSTTPESTILSLRSLSRKYPDRKIILIAGGADKAFHYQKLAKYIERNIEYTLLFSGTGTDKLKQSFSPSFEKFTEIISMKTAVNLAMKHAEDEHALIILSPGAASFGVFNNEYDRHDQFIKEYKQI